MGAGRDEGSTQNAEGANSRCQKPEPLKSARGSGRRLGKCSRLRIDMENSQILSEKYILTSNPIFKN